MGEFMHLLMLTFVPLFVAIDPIGMVPIYLGVTGEFNEDERRRVTWQACLTVLILSVGFLLAGKALFRLLNITQYDFQVAGGSILLVLAVIDIVQTGKERRRTEATSSLGVVPLGTPMIAGPALLTTLLLLADLHPTVAGRVALGVSLVVNVGLVMVVFRQADWVSRVVGKGGMVALSKVFGLFLAAIGVMMVRQGVMGMSMLWGGH